MRTWTQRRHPTPPGLFMRRCGLPSAQKRGRGAQVWLTAILLCGVVCGGLWQSSAFEEERYLHYFAQQYLARYAAGNFWPVFTAGYLTAVLLLGFVLFFSLSCIGAPLLVCVPFCKGLTTGCVAAYLYLQWGIRGMLTNLLLLLVPETIKMCALLALVCTALDTSVGLFRMNFGQAQLGVGAKIAHSLRTFMGVTTLTLVAMLLEAATAAVFGPVLLGAA